MEKQTLPNSTLILIFGILSILGCCCYGIVGIIFAIIVLILVQKANALYVKNPEIYTGYDNVKTGKILAIVGLIISSIFLILIISIFSIIGSEGIKNMRKELMEQSEQI